MATSPERGPPRTAGAPGAIAAVFLAVLSGCGDRIPESAPSATAEGEVAAIQALDQVERIFNTGFQLKHFSKSL